MNTLQEIISQKPPESLYHYTSQSGLLGILNSKSIWASKIQYLNDATEFEYTISIARGKIRQRLLTATGDGKQCLEKLRSQADNVSGINIFVACFSTLPDLLSQWRAYCPIGQGFSIGFPTERFSSLMSEQQFMLVPCVYDLELYHEVVDDLIEATTEKWRHTALDASGYSPVELQFVAELIAIAPILKHPSFVEEKEWRLVSTPKLSSDANVRFREGKSMLLPYFDFQLAHPETKLEVGEIYVAVSHPELSRNSVMHLLDSTRTAWGGVLLSEVPFRAW